jgi:hypothetical protein
MNYDTFFGLSVGVSAVAGLLRSEKILVLDVLERKFYKGKAERDINDSPIDVVRVYRQLALLLGFSVSLSHPHIVHSEVIGSSKSKTAYKSAYSKKIARE